MLHSNTADEKTKKFIQQTLNFESNMYKLSFKHCCICHQRRLNMKTSNGICYRCQNKKNEMFYSYENKLLPTWKTKNNIIKLLLVSIKCGPQFICSGIAGNKYFLELKTPMIEGMPKMKMVLKSTNFCFNLEMTPAILLSPTMANE